MLYLSHWHSSDPVTNFALSLKFTKVAFSRSMKVALSLLAISINLSSAWVTSPSLIHTKLARSSIFSEFTAKSLARQDFGLKIWRASLGGILGGIDNVLRGGMNPRASSNPDDPSTPWQDRAPSWEEIKKHLTSVQTDEEKRFRNDLAAGRGPANSLATLRLFDAPDGTEPIVTLYRGKTP